MDPPAVIPWLALGLAALSFGWQVIEAWRRRATRVVVEVQHATLPAMPDGPELLELPGIGIDDRTVVWPADEPLTYVIVISAVNRGESQEWLHDMRCFDVAGTMAEGANPGDPGMELPPRQRRSWAFRVDQAQFDLAEGFNVDVILGSTTIRSGPHFLDERLRQDIAAHNATHSR